jgi:two-component system osmolarity sensor histidine kinase EnvZ
MPDVETTPSSHSARFPESLLARAFLLIVVLIVVSLAASAAMFRHVENEPRAQQMAQLVVSVVNLTRAAVLSSAPEWRGALLAELDAAEGLQVQMAEDGDAISPLQTERSDLRLMVSKVRAVLGNDTEFASERNGIAGLWVSFYIGDEKFWVALPKERIEYPVSQVLLAGGGVVLMLALFGAYLIARQVALPLGRLAKAAQQVGSGQTPTTLPESGAREMVAVARAFNRMSTDLAAHERERALVLAGISHDLRTPLARLRLAAEMSADESLCAGMHEDVEQMDSVIQQFLDYARLDSNETAKATDVAQLVNRVAQQYAARARSLALDIQPVDLLAVRPLLLERALVNLLDNAIKYGGGEITVRLAQTQQAVEISVADRGAGIPEHERETVKRPFVRLDAARSDATGSGLGLAIVARAAQLHGGQFILSDNPEGGLLAKLMLPRSGPIPPRGEG